MVQSTTAQKLTGIEIRISELWSRAPVSGNPDPNFGITNFYSINFYTSVTFAPPVTLIECCLLVLDSEPLQRQPKPRAVFTSRSFVPEGVRNSESHYT